MAFGMYEVRVDNLKMATLSAGQTPSVLCQDAASCAPSSSATVCVGIHMYSCECYDYANGPLCKHVHAVWMQVNTVFKNPGKTEVVHNPTPTAIAEKENTLPGEHYTLYSIHHTCHYTDNQHLSYRSTSTTI